MSIIPLYGYTIICLSIHLLMDIYVVSSFWLLQIKLLRTFMHKDLCGHMLSFVFGRFLAVERLRCVVGIFLLLLLFLLVMFQV